MIIDCKTEAKDKTDPSSLATAEYWARRGAKTAAFLLVIPGCAVVGYGIGLLTGQVVPASVIGFGAGLLVWGLIVALTD